MLLSTLFFLASIISSTFCDLMSIQKRNNNIESKKLPEALIIGVKKSGTRALLEFSRLHPDIRATGPEVHFFDKNYHKGLKWYRNQMPSTLPGQLTMEKTPSYFITKQAPQRIYKMSNSTKLIVVLRDPVTRALSDYAQASSKRKNMPSFERMAFLDNGVVNSGWNAIKIGLYYKYIQRWLEYFPIERILFVNGEELISSPGNVMNKVQIFLGIPVVINQEHFYFSKSKNFPCLKKGRKSGKPKCLNKNKGRVHPKIDNRTLKRLRDFYRPFNVKLKALTGINFD